MVQYNAVAACVLEKLVNLLKCDPLHCTTARVASGLQITFRKLQPSPFTAVRSARSPKVAPLHS